MLDYDRFAPMADVHEHDRDARKLLLLFAVGSAAPDEPPLKYRTRFYILDWRDGQGSGQR